MTCNYDLSSAKHDAYDLNAPLCPLTTCWIKNVSWGIEISRDSEQNLKQNQTFRLKWLELHQPREVSGSITEELFRFPRSGLKMAGRRYG